MQRVYGLVDDELVHRIDQAAGENGASRAQWVRMAIEAYLANNGEKEGIDAVKLQEETANLRAEAVNLQTETEASR